MSRRLNGRALVCLFLMAVAAAAFVKAAQWPLSAKLFPMVVSVPLFFLAFAEFAFNVFGAKEAKEAKEDGKDEKAEQKYSLIIFAWCLAFLALVVLLGMAITVPLFVFLYLKAYAKERWVVSLALTVSAGVFFYGLFVYLLNIHFESGLLQQGLKTVGIL